MRDEILIAGRREPPKRVECEWRVKTGLIEVGPTPRTVLQIRAIKDAQVTSCRVDFPQFLEASEGWWRAECVWVVQERCLGKRAVRVERIGGPARIVAVEDIAYDQQLETADGQLDLPFNVIESPYDYWQWLGRLPRMTPDKNRVMGLVVACNRPTRCRATVAGW